MKSLKSFMKKTGIVTILFLSTAIIAIAQTPTYLCELRNDVQVNARTFEFDVYLLRTGTTVFEYSSMQFGINVNPGMRNGGTIAVSLVSGTSELNPTQIPGPGRFSFSTASNCIIMTGTPPPGAGSGTIISNTGFGTRVGRIRLVNSADFGSVTPDLIWSFSISTGYPTKVNAYFDNGIDGMGSYENTVAASHSTSNLVNALLNPPPPVQYAVSGGGSYCQGGPGVEIRLSNSQIGVTYSLLRGADLVATVVGAGNPIIFDNQTVAGTYSVTGTNAGGTTPMSGNAVVSVNPLPSVPAAQAGSGAACNGITANWAPAANATTYQLDVSTSSTFASFVSGYQSRDVGNVITHNVTGLVTGTTYYYRIRTVNSCGVSASSGTITYTTLSVPEQPGTISGQVAPCPNTTGLTYEVPVVTGATSYTWTVPAGWIITSGASSRTITVTSATSGGTISVYASNACGDGIGRSLSVTVGTTSTAPSSVNITNNNTCNGTSKVLTVTGGSLGTGAQWEWFTGSCGGTSAGTGPSITVDPAAGTSTVYYVRASGTCNTTTCANGTVLVPGNVGIPTVPVPSANTICQGSPSTTVTTSSTNATSFNWTISGTGNTISGTGSMATVSWSPSFSGVATISVSANGCGGPTVIRSTTVTVRPTPTASISGTTSVCQNASSPLITFTNPQSLPVTVAYNINGSSESNINVGASGTATLTVPTTTAGTFNYNLVSVTYQTVPSCSNNISGTAIVTVNPTPAVSDKTESITTGGSFSITPTEAPTGTTYTWSVPTYTNGVTGGVAQATGVASISGTLSIPSGSGTAVYKVTPRTGTCVGSTFTLTVTVTSSCVPVLITTNPVDASICAGGNALFSVTATGTTPAYQWQYYNGSAWVSVANGIPAGAVYTNATTTTLGVAGITTAGSYQYRSNATNCGTSNAQSSAAILTVNAIPATPTVNVTQPTCGTATGTITVTAPPPGAGMTYSINGSTYTNTTGIFTSVAPGTYTVTARSAAGCTSAGSSATVNDQPPTPVVGNQTVTISSGGTFNVTPVGTPTGTTYTWSVPTYTGGVTGGVAQATGVAIISGTLSIPSGSGTAVYTVTPRTGTCVGSTFTLTVTVTSSCVPVLITTNPVDASMCAGGSASFSVTATGTSPAYQWQYYNGSAWVSVANGIPAGAVYTNATTTTLGVAGITAAGSYQYRSNATNCGTSNAQSNAAILTVNAIPPQPIITADGPLAFCSGEDVVLTAPESSSYLWSNLATTRSITVTTAGNFTVRVTNAGGCQSVPSATAVVTVNPLPTRPTITPAGSVSTCAGTSQTLTSSAGTSYLWSNGETTQSISVNTTGSYTVQVANAFGCLSVPSVATNVAVNPLPATPTITASGPTDICAGSSVTLTSSVSTSYLWSTGATTRSISVNTAGNYSVRVADAIGCQSLPSAITAVTVNALPIAPIIGTITQPSCTVPTGSVILNGLPVGAWTINPGNITGSTTTATITNLSAGSRTFTVTNSNGCTSTASLPVVINIPPAVPTAPVIGAVTQPTCAVTTGSVGISGLPSPGNWTLTRNPGGVEVTGSGATFTVTGILAGTYTFTVTNAAGCISPVSGSVTINAPLPVPAAPLQSVDCSLGFNRAVVTVTSPTGTGYEYRLDAGNWQTGNVFNNVANGTHTITVRNSSGCMTVGAQFSVNCGCANPPLLTLAATSGSTCGITAVTFSGNTFGGSATSVTITENGGGTVTPTTSSTSPFSFTYNPTAADAGRIVIITVTTNNPLGSPCAAASATFSLTVNANPAAPVRGTVTQPTCALPTGSVILNSLPATGEWTITRTPGGQTTTGSGTSTTITGLTPGTYTFTVTNALGCISPASANVVINVQPDTPTAPVTGIITQPTCALSTGSVALSGLPSTDTWTLTRLPGNNTITAIGTTRTVPAIPPGTYTFTVTNAAGCVSPPSAEVVINRQPVTPTAPVIGAITHPTCELATGSIVLENMPETGEWTLIRYPGGTSSTGTGSSATISSLSSGTYNFAVRNADGCTSQVSGNAVINAQPPTPTIPVVGVITHPTFAIATGSVVLSGLPTGDTWTLIRYPDGITSQGTGTTHTVLGLEPGTYTFAVTNFAGCTSTPTNDVVINARPGVPVLVINNPPTICSNETTDLTLPAVTAGSGANLTFTYWTDALATVTYATPTAAPAGTYYIMGTSTAGYSAVKPVIVTADELPTAYAGPDQVLQYIFHTTLNADIPGYGTGIWELVTGTGNISDPAAPSTDVSRLSVGDNVFSWTVTNGACDPVIDMVVIKVNNLIIPTLITPNQDTKNDRFILPGREETLGKTELTIFDRRGHKVYENRDYQDEWEGLDYNSNPLPDDTYFYVIRAKNGVSISGYIVVRR